MINKPHLSIRFQVEKILAIVNSADPSNKSSMKVCCHHWLDLTSGMSRRTIPLHLCQWVLILENTSRTSRVRVHCFGGLILLFAAPKS